MSACLNITVLKRFTLFDCKLTCMYIIPAAYASKSPAWKVCDQQVQILARWQQVGWNCCWNALNAGRILFVWLLLLNVTQRPKAKLLTLNPMWGLFQGSTASTVSKDGTLIRRPDPPSHNKVDATNISAWQQSAIKLLSSLNWVWQTNLMPVLSPLPHPSPGKSSFYPPPPTRPLFNSIPHNRSKSVATLLANQQSCQQSRSQEQVWCVMNEIHSVWTEHNGQVSVMKAQLYRPTYALDPCIHHPVIAGTINYPGLSYTRSVHAFITHLQCVTLQCVSRPAVLLGYRYFLGPQQFTWPIRIAVAPVDHLRYAQP